MLDPEEQIRLPWNPEYDIWHSRWFPLDANPSLTADKMEFLEYFLNGKKWAVIPGFLLQKAIQETRRGFVRWKSATGGHDDLWTQKRESDG